MPEPPCCTARRFHSAGSHTRKLIGCAVGPLSTGTIRPSTSHLAGSASDAATQRGSDSVTAETGSAIEAGGMDSPIFAAVQAARVIVIGVSVNLAGAGASTAWAIIGISSLRITGRHYGSSQYVRLVAMSLRKLFTAAAAAVCAVSLHAQDAPKPTKPESPKEFKALKYRNIGPAAGGRVARVTGVPGYPMRYYAATASGGVWLSSDGGATWKSI